MFWRPHTPAEKELNEVMNKFKKASSTNSVITIMNELTPYIPEFNFIILYNFAGKFTDLLLKSDSEGQPSRTTIGLIIHMIKSYEFAKKELLEGSRSQSETADKKSAEEIEKKSQNLTPYKALFKQSKFFDNLFDLLKTPNPSVLFIIESFFNDDPIIVTNWIKSQKRIEKGKFMNLIKLVSETKDPTAAKLLQRLSVSHPDIIKALTPIFIPKLKTFPVSIVLDLMLASNDIRESFPSVDFESWLMESGKYYTMSDIEMIIKFHEVIWKTESAAKLLLKSLPPEKMADIMWISRMEAQDLELTQEVIDETSASMNPVNVEFNSSSDCESSRDPFMFIRIFVLSFSDPEKVTPEAINTLIRLVKDPSPFVAAAAVQCLILWVLKFNFDVRQSLVYRIAYIAADTKLPPSLRYLYFVALQVFGTKQDIATAILQADTNLRYESKMKMKIIRESWCFPHFKTMFETINKIKLCDYNHSKGIIDYISDFLNEYEDYEYEEEQEEASEDSNNNNQMEQLNNQQQEAEKNAALAGQNAEIIV
ncbi:hypothetical protein TRFO_42299 [Tritrichomonas foetus]|uniref:Uncharacterized protein n=1 Tax=Tritrichomonas foetus TaxID=1144522 RepID=A0A1J4KWY8_9EUKA|nr:hypothetical protein TRFO_42299 [Tritrichomonas foetus]|eukprot:OHT15763.1 hypothetical protein TRFO_42299 [Tritrichomonas foetus]